LLICARFFTTLHPFLFCRRTFAKFSLFPPAFSFIIVCVVCFEMFLPWRDHFSGREACLLWYFPKNPLSKPVCSPPQTLCTKHSFSHSVFLLVEEGNPPYLIAPVPRGFIFGSDKDPLRVYSVSLFVLSFFTSV